MGGFSNTHRQKVESDAIILSQIARKYRSEANTEEEIREVSLCDATESGSFENLCSVVLGMWKTSKTDMECRVLKNTKGLAGNTVAMRFATAPSSSSRYESS
jgi:hypothetical protein